MLGPEVLSSELGADNPEVREERFDGGGEIGNAGGATSANFAAYSALDHFDVAIAPFLYAFVHVDQVFAGVADVGIVAVGIDEDGLNGW